MRREEWNKASDSEKLDLLFNWSERLEEAVKRLDVSIQMLDSRLKILAESAGNGTPAQAPP